MKNRIAHCFCFLTIVFAGCDSFLQSSDKDVLIPKTVEQYRQLLIGEGYPDDFQGDADYVKLMTDDIEIWAGNEKKDQTSDVARYKGVFTWQKDLEEEMEKSDGAYSGRYKNILGCNLIINDRDKIEGSIEDINLLIAQALVLRAYNYFCLVNWYAKPYDEKSAATDPGVCIWLETKPSLERLYRKSIAEVYRLINADMDEALQLFGKASIPDNKFEVSYEGALVLASRIALFQKDWSRVKKHGEELLKLSPTLYNLTSGDIAFGESSFSFISPTKNPEVLFNFGSVSSSYRYIYSISGSTAGPFFQVSRFADDALLKLYDMAKDNRVKAFFDVEKYQYVPLKYSRTPSQGKGEAWRVAEVYLNLAEAYVLDSREPDLERALELLNDLRRNRIVDYVDENISDYTSNTLLEAIRIERRKELCFEETHRWWDLRRQGMPELKHVLINNGGLKETFILENGDGGYVLEIPRKEREYNTAIQLNNRPERHSVEHKM